MDIYIADFIRKNKDTSNAGLSLLMWALLTNRKNGGKINQHLSPFLKSQDKLFGGYYQRAISKYDKILGGLQQDNVNEGETSGKLKSLQVANFRGFTKVSEDDRGVFIDFNSKVNIFFAPNGGGKTSLCEAIEYATTNTIKEAERRKTTIRNYIKRDGGVVLELKDAKGNAFKAAGSNVFGFIDRNRLQEFSLLGSKDTKFSEKDVLAALVGLEEFDLFLGKFVKPENFDILRYVSKEHKEVYEKALNNLKLFKDDVNKYKKEIEESINRMLKNMGASKVPLRYASQAVDLFRKRIIKEKEHLYSSRAKLNVSRRAIVFDKDVLKLNIRLLYKFTSRKENISVKKERFQRDLNYYELYRAAHSIFSCGTEDKCPLCLTSFEKSEVDPVSNVNDCLKKLNKIAYLDRREKELGSKILAIVTKVIQELREYSISPLVDNKYLSETSASEIIKLLGEGVSSDFHCGINRIEKILFDENTTKAYLEKAVKHNEKILEIEKSIAAIESSIKRMESKEDFLKGEFSSIKKAKQLKSECTTRLLNEMSNVAQLKFNYFNEEKYNDFIIAIKDEYNVLYQLALDYKVNCEAEILSGLKASVLEFYNKINYHDNDYEKIDNIDFEFSQKDSTYRILLNSGGRVSDAFISLSEGHLKSLGLSILLSLAKKKNTKFIVFDDVVNAIDTEHRSNIIQVFLTDDFIKKTQIILTTHDRFFWEMFSNQCKKIGTGDFNSYVLGCEGNGIHLIKKDVSFESKIEESLMCYDIRQALIYCRIWFESLCSEYCVTQEFELRGRFSSRQFQQPNYIKVSIESMYGLILDTFSLHSENIDIIKNSLINWSAQNQEHHAFNENGYNIVHAKTSNEVKVIFKSIRRFEIQTCASKKLFCLVRDIKELYRKLGGLNVKVNSDNIPESKKLGWRKDISQLNSKIIELEDLRSYCIFLLLNTN
ncbi:hypothetical protein B1H58_02475 [Pantoea alhagi]|uniref:ATPase AAA-type core domain-containing protein n=1 Tax=Pantoea alhagi TaxID=1891675 RepID=A0A1W6B1K8_9GAMM|nr:AAA family ATPase [Pantoea alhagi]ARJ40971.1 hypothetical protein B1H58_02475 [Pantoea alhagi]